MKKKAYRDEPDDELMRYCTESDDAEAFALLVRRHQTRVLGYAARMFGGDLDGAADVAQEAFVCLWNHRAAYQPQGKLLSYLLHVTHNRCISDLRMAGKRETISLDAGRDTPAHPALFGKAKAVHDAVLDLPEEQRSVFILSEYEGLTYAEIAEALGIPAGTVASRKNRAVQLLRVSLNDWLNDEQGGIK